MNTQTTTYQGYRITVCGGRFNQRHFWFITPETPPDAIRKSRNIVDAGSSPTRQNAVLDAYDAIDALLEVENATE